jgi:alpha-L-rhamnosidase
MPKTALLLLFLAAAASARPVHLRCDYRTNPLGIDVATPRLSWQSDATTRNWRQSAYEIRVASSPALLAKPDVWDSGRQTSAESNDIPYAGPTLEARHRYFWTVRVWDADGQSSDAAAPAWWEMGLLQKSDWSAKWITRQNPEDAGDRADIRWIWPRGDAFSVKPGTVAVFRRTFDLNELPASAALFTAARWNYKATVNGTPVGAKDNWRLFERDEILTALVKGRNVVEISVTVPPRPEYGPDAGPPDSPRPAGLAALVKVTNADGSVVRMPTDAEWEGRIDGDSQFAHAAAVAPLGDTRMGADPGPLPQPAALLRKEFHSEKTVKAARVYVTALGAYELFLNGKRVGNDYLTPGFTDYARRVNYQTYDVTQLLVKGANAVGVLLGDGWFASGMAWTGEHFAILPPTRLLAQLDIQYSDGTRANVVSDESWKCAQSPILTSTIYGGETYDARLERAGWNRAGFDDANWTSAGLSEVPATVVVSSEPAQPVRLALRLKPKTVKEIKPGMQIFDMGQNMVGWAVLRVSGKAGTTVRLRFAEILNPDGSIYTQNLRNADVTDYYTLKGGTAEAFRPHFSFHGFRYVEVTGYPGQPSPDDLTGEVLSSITGEPTGTLVTSSELVNRMYGIGLWGQRGNFLSVPTDCPQRDERLGWMGDAGVFWRTGAYNFDIAAFTHKWMPDVVDAQSPQGAFTNTSPDLGLGFKIEGAPGWGDAGVIVPWTTWMQYGDTGLVRRDWDAMERWMKFIGDGNPDFVRTKRLGPNFADWLAPDPNTDRSLIATAYWAMMARMMKEMAAAIDRQPDAQRYSTLFDEIRSAFQKTYIKDDGEIGTGTQTSYVLALHMNLVPDTLKKNAVEKLVKAIEAKDWHLTTGFLGTPHLLFALADNGRADVAYRLLLNETYPSWGYMLSKGATTWWERWNSDTGDPSMNSFNHYAFGSVIAWVYRSVAGIDTVPEAPGFKQILIHPRFDPSLTHARGEYDSVYGKIVTDWTKSGDSLSLKVTVPANTTARVVLPALPNSRLTESRKPTEAKAESGNLVLNIGSGTYNFEMN